MFGAMMNGIAQDFVQLRHARPGRGRRGAAAGASRATCSTRRADDPVQGAPASMARPRPRGREVAGDAADAARRRRPPSRAPMQQPVVKAEWDKTPRNAPCPCGAARSSSCATAAERRTPMRDFSDDLADAAPPARRGARATCSIDAARAASAAARGRGRRARPVGRPGPGQARSTPSYADVQRRRRAVRRPRRRRSTTSRRCTSWPARRTTSRRSPRSTTAIAALARAARPARAARAVHRRARRARRDLQIHVRRRRHRRAGLGRDAAAHVPALGRAARLRRRARRGLSEGPEAGHHRRPTFIVKGRYAYGLLAGRARRAPAGAHLARSTPTRGARPRSRRSRSCPLLEDGRRARDRRDRPAHRHLPVVGRRRPARQRDRLGGAHHPPADRDRRVVPERAQPAPEQGRRRCRSSQAMLAERKREKSARPSSTRIAGRAGARSASAARSARYVLQPYQMVKDLRTELRDRQRRRRCSTATSTTSWRPTCAGSGLLQPSDARQDAQARQAVIATKRSFPTACSTVWMSSKPAALI